MSIKSPFAAVALAVVLAAPAAARPLGNAGDTAALTPTEAETLTYMREEEKLARDVYRVFYGEWGLQIFANISRSEQTHTDKIKLLLDKYREPDPVLDDRTGVFTNDNLAELYDDCLTKGEVSEADALHVAAAIEEIDMIDLERAIDESAKADLKTVYGQLLRGSRNHLRAFVGQIEAQGIEYDAQYLSQEEVDAIVDSPVERGGRRRRR